MKSGGPRLEVTINTTSVIFVVVGFSLGYYFARRTLYRYEGE